MTRKSHAHFLVLTTGVASALLAGCGLSTLTSGLGGGVFGGGSSPSQSQTAGVSEEQLLAAAKLDPAQAAGGGGEISYGCPRFNISPRDNNVTIYESGRVGDALAVMHRGEITKTARECTVDAGRVTVKYGFSGRLLMGPKGRAGNISLPVTVFVADAKRDRISTEKLRVDAQVTMDRPIGYFSLVRTVTFNLPVGTRPGEFELFVGFERTIPGAG